MMSTSSNGGRAAAIEAPTSAKANTEPDQETLAVIALALSLEDGTESVRIADNRATSNWALAGRARVLRGR